MSSEQSIFEGDTPEILVDVIVDGQHVAATIDSATTRVDGNAAVPTVATIGTGNYKVSFPGLTPAPTEGDTLYIKVNGSVDSSGTAWTEAVYKLKVLPREVGAPEVADAVLSESLASHSGTSGSVAERISKLVYTGQSFTYTKDSNPSHTQDVTIS